MGIRLSGKIAAITGGAGGIGAAIGDVFAAQGARVALVDHNSEAVERVVNEIRRANPGADVFGIVADLGIEAESDRTVAEIVERCAGLDVLVNNVGIRRYEALVNAVCPGYTMTPFHVRRLGPAGIENLVPPCALKRWAVASELAYPILWLASDEASYVTGATLMVDGGLPA